MSQIVEIPPSDLPQWMKPTAQPRLIEFYASWCIYHLLTKRKLERLQAALGGDIMAGSIDSLGNESMFRRYGIHQIPTIGFFCQTKRLLWVGDTDLSVMLDDIRRLSFIGQQQ